MVLDSVMITMLLYKFLYYNSKKFNRIKIENEAFINDCNELNDYISSYISIDDFLPKKYGRSSAVELSKYNMKRKFLTDERKDDNVYNCSLDIVKKSEENPFYYVCKYFGIPKDEESIKKFEDLLNKTLMIEDGILCVNKKREDLYAKFQIPWVIRTFFSNSIDKHIGFNDVKIIDDFYIKYIFCYTSAGGNSQRINPIIMDSYNISEFIQYLCSECSRLKSVKHQRALMTPKLREEIKERDKYTCKCCGVSISDEPHLLLEVDHIIPVSKGGLTEKENLQTLCWRCNRKKSSHT